MTGTVYVCRAEQFELLHHAVEYQYPLRLGEAPEYYIPDESVFVPEKRVYCSAGRSPVTNQANAMLYHAANRRNQGPRIKRYTISIPMLIPALGNEITNFSQITQPRFSEFFVQDLKIAALLTAQQFGAIGPF